MSKYEGLPWYLLDREYLVLIAESLDELKEQIKSGGNVRGLKVKVAKKMLRKWYWLW